MAKTTASTTSDIKIKSADLFDKQPATWLLISVLLLTTYIVFYPSLSAYFINLDDPAYLLENRSLVIFSQEWSWEAVKQIFSSDVSTNYSPLVMFTYAIEKYFFAPDVLSSVSIFHFDNLLLHLGCTLCVFFLFLKMDIKKWGAFLGALLFGIHPMRVESVAWITERKDVLYGLFFLLSLITYINYIKSEKGKTRWYVITILLSTLAYFSKVQAVSLPLCMVALDFYFKRKWYAPKTIVLEKLPWWVLSLTFGLISIYFLRANKVLDTVDVLARYSVIDKFAMGMYAFAIYVVKFIYPYQMSAYYAYPAKPPVLAYISLIAVPVLLIWSMWKLRKKKDIMFGLVFFIFNIVFLLQIVSAGVEYLTDRFTYIAYVGLFFIAAHIYIWAIERFPSSRKPIQTVLGLYLVLMAAMAYNQTKVWQNSVSLWKHYVNDYPEDYYGYFELGRYYTDVSLHKLPDPYLDVNDPEFTKIGLNYLDMAEMKDSINGKPFHHATADILFYHGLANGVVHNDEAAITDFTKAITLVPNKKEAYLGRGWTYGIEKKYDLAIDDYDRFQKLDSTNDITYYYLSIWEGNTQKLSESMRDINKAIKINSGNAEYYMARASLYKALNMPDSMHIDARNAQQLGANVPNTLLE